MYFHNNKENMQIPNSGVFKATATGEIHATYNKSGGRAVFGLYTHVYSFGFLQ